MVGRGIGPSTPSAGASASPTRPSTICARPTSRSHRSITRSLFAHWDDIEINFAGQRILSGGHGFSGIARKKLLEILQQRAAEVGVALRFEREVDDVVRTLRTRYDLLVGADGIQHSQACAARYAEAFATLTSTGGVAALSGSERRCRSTRSPSSSSGAEARLSSHP